MFNDTHTPLSLLLSRRSGKPRDMVAPGPDAEQMATILSAASRVPDHGKLAPWRFVTVATDQRDTLADLLVTAYRAEKPEAGKLELDAMVQFAQQAPALVVVLSSPVSSSKIPLWEQELSVGAACMQLLNAAHALGFVGGPASVIFYVLVGIPMARLDDAVRRILRVKFELGLFDGGASRANLEFAVVPTSPDPAQKRERQGLPSFG